MAKKESLRSLRSLWAKQLQTAYQQADERERDREKRAKGTSKDVLVINKKAFAQYTQFLLAQGGREALIDLLTDEGSLQESLRLTVEYYARELV